MSDLINRKQAIELCREYADSELTSTEKSIGAEYCIEFLEHMPSAEPELKWIPVNERLPKNEQHVLCAVEWYPDGETNIVSGCRYKDGVWETIIEAPLYDYWAEIVDVLAWMPYPEPYRIGEEK